jgi:hypothetical protein
LRGVSSQTGLERGICFDDTGFINPAGLLLGILTDSEMIAVWQVALLAALLAP